MRLFLTAASLLALSAAPALAEEARIFDIWQSTGSTKTLIALAATGEKAPFIAAAGADKASLDLLAADEASLAIVELRAMTAAKIETAEKAAADDSDDETKSQKKVIKIEKLVKHEHDADHPEEHAATESDSDDKAAPETVSAEAPHKIVLIKQVVAGDKSEKKEVRRVIKLSGDKPTEAEIAALIEKAKGDLKAEGGDLAIEQGALAADDADAALLASASGAKVVVVENIMDGASTRLVSITGADADSARAFIDKAEGLEDAEKAKIKTDLGL
ncbi:MAG: hypothetical protein ABL957_02510 [Parvularculaceae bacterium]